MNWSLPKSDEGQIAAAAASAARRYQVEGGLVQDWLKPTTLLFLDALLGHELPVEPSRLWLAVNNMQADAGRVWSTEQSRVAVEHYEVLVDFHYFAGERTPYSKILTAESEGYPHAVRELARLEVPGAMGDWPNNGLLWDLWKLIIVPSQLRVFTTIATQPQFERIAAHFAAMLGRHAHVGHAGSPFALVCFDPERATEASVRVSLWESGQWQARARVATERLAEG